MVYIGQLTGDEFSDFLNAWKKDRHPFQVVCEEYIQLPFKKTNWFNKQQVIRCIGAIELKCKEFDVPLIMQQSNILPMAQKHFQVEMPKNHDATHQFAAYLHGAEYLFRAGLKQSQLETELADASSKKEE